MQLIISGVTRVGVTRGGNRRVSPLFFPEKKSDFFSHRLWKVMTFLAVVSHSHLPTFLSSVLSKCSHKNNFRLDVTPSP